MTRAEAIRHFEYGITHDIFKEPVTSYAKIAIAALKEQEEYEGLKNSYDQLQASFDQIYDSNMKMGEDLRSRPKWISVENAYPDEGVKVLGYNERSGSYGVATYSKRWEKWRAAGSTAPTHWTTLPDPPKEEE